MLSRGTTDIWDQTALCCGRLSYAEGRLATSLATIPYMPEATPTHPSVTTKNVLTLQIVPVGTDISTSREPLLSRNKGNQLSPLPHSALPQFFIK